MDWSEFLRIFNDCELDGNKIIIKSKLREVINFVIANYTYNMLKEIIANDKGEGKTELIYHFYSTDDEEDMFISITVDGEVESIADIFKSAAADENEIYDLFGVKFIGNETAKQICAGYYNAHNKEEMYSLLNEVILANNDSKKSERDLIIQSMNLDNNYAAQNIVNEIINDL